MQYFMVVRFVAISRHKAVTRTFSIIFFSQEPYKWVPDHNK